MGEENLNLELEKMIIEIQWVSENVEAERKIGRERESFY